MKKMYRAVAVGGTFDLLHRGHGVLLKKAFQIGRLVVIGVTSDEFALKMGKHPNSYAMRTEKLRSYLHRTFPHRRYEIHPLDDYFGPRIYDAEVQAVVVSEETSARIHIVNEAREAKGLKPLKMIVVETVLADNGRSISTTRIKQKAIDEDGRVVRSRSQ